MHTLLKTSVLAATTGVLMLSCSSAKEMTAESLNGEWNVIQIEAQKITPAENTPVVGTLNICYLIAYKRPRFRGISYI